MLEQLLNSLMAKFIFNTKYSKLYYYFLLITLVFVVSGLVFYQALLIDIVKYLVFQIFFILLPGYQIFSFLRIREERLCKLIFSYGIGIVLHIMLYLCLFKLNLLNLLFIIGPSLSLTVLINLYKRRYRADHELIIKVKEILLPQFWFIYSLILFITFWGFTLANPTPNLIGTMQYPTDVIWMIGNAESLLRNIPPFDARMSGVDFNYHYFTAVYWAVMSYITKINPFDLVFKYYQIGNLLLICGSVFVLGKSIFKNDQKAIAFMWVYFFTACASLIFPYFNGYGRFLNVNFVHITNDPFGFELSLPLFLLCCSLCIKQINSNKFDWGRLIASVGLIAACTGAKGPSGFMIIAGLFSTVLFAQVIKKKERPKSLLLFSLVLSLVVFLVYRVIIVSGYPASGGNTLSIYPGYTAKISILQSLINVNQVNDTLVRVLSAIVIPVHFFLFLPFASSLFFAWIIRIVRKLNEVENSQIFITSLGACGIVLTYLLGQSGNSQIYFIMFSIPFITLCGLKWLFDNSKSMSRYLKVLFVCLFLISSVSSLSMNLYQGKLGALKVSKVISGGTELIQSVNRMNSISNHEYEAMIWLREKTHPYAIIASDRWYIDNAQKYSRYFYYSTLSNRQIYLEGWDYTSDYIKNNIVPAKVEMCNNLYYKSEINKNLIMEQEGIDYLIVSKFLHNDLDSFNTQLIKVFENKDIVIYSSQ